MKLDKVLLLVVLFLMMPFAEDSSINNSEDQNVDELELLKREIADLKKESEELSKKKDAIVLKDDVYEKDEKDEKIGNFDTLKLVTKEGAKAFLQSFSGTKRNTRERGYGGAMGPVFGIHSVNIENVVAALERDPGLGDYAFDGDYETFLMIGGVIYGGIGNGVRIGGAGWGGTRSFVSKTDENKSVSVGLGYGGFLVEKCFVRKNINVAIGGILGAGGFTVTPKEISDSFIDNDVSYEFSAGFMLAELHSGITYSMKSWMHFGFDLAAPIFISPSGFEVNDISVTNGFATFNPGFRIKLVFGNLG